jgi:hypothetical protein
MKQILSIFLIAFSLSSIAIIRKKGFDPNYLLTTNEPSDSIDFRLEKFTFIGCGRQSFAFIDDKNRYVLKIINQSRFDMHPLLKNVPLPSFLHEWRDKKLSRRQKRVRDFFLSYQIAFDYLKEETAIEYFHFSNLPEEYALVTDPTNITWFIDLSNCWFVVQKKMDLFPEVLEMYKKRPHLWIRTITSFFELVKKRCDKGIADDDLNVLGNVGFIGTKAYLLDPGRIYLDPAIKEGIGRREEIRKSSKHLRAWIAKNQPDMLSLFLELYPK